MQNSNLENEIRKLAETATSREGLEVVEMRLRGAGRHSLLRLDIDRAGPHGVTIDDCQRVSRFLSAALDERDLIPTRYTIEVSSPGVDRPIRTEDDIRRNSGRRVVVETSDLGQGRRTVRGVLLGSDGGDLLVAEGGENPVRIPIASIASARQEVGS